MRVDQLVENEQWLNPSDYGKALNGIWYCMTACGLIGNLNSHEVIENKDGTITVSPSILISCGDLSWHGYIENGKWRTV